MSWLDLVAVPLLARVCLAVLFPFSALDKILHWKDALQQVDSSFLPRATGPPLLVASAPTGDDADRRRLDDDGIGSPMPSAAAGSRSPAADRERCARHDPAPQLPVVATTGTAARRSLGGWPDRPVQTPSHA